MTRTAITIRIDKNDATRAYRPAGYTKQEVVLIDRYGTSQWGLDGVFHKVGNLGLAPPEVAFDLLVLAAAITAADTRVPRTDAQDRWTREIHLAVPVSNVGRWMECAEMLCELLGFLSGDRWSLSFHKRPAGHKRLAYNPSSLRTWQPSCVCLFSGGLDSFVGAIDLLATKKEPLFISHYWDSDTSKHQTYVYDRLRRHFPKRIMDVVRARIGFDSDLFGKGNTENTLRARSFLFFAMAVYAASGIGQSTNVVVPENGFISLNVPLDGVRLGSLSTRTTHPWYMERWNELLSALGIDVRLDNPYGLLTKGEMLAKCADQAVLKAEIAHTMSCSSANKLRWKGDTPGHCGHCVPCLIRRGSIKAAFGKDPTKYHIKSLSAQRLNTERAEGEHIRSFQVAIHRVRARPSLGQFLIHQSGPLTDHSHELAKYERVYRAGLSEVAKLLKGVDVRPS